IGRGAVVADDQALARLIGPAVAVHAAGARAGGAVLTVADVEVAVVALAAATFRARRARRPERLRPARAADAQGGARAVVDAALAGGTLGLANADRAADLHFGRAHSDHRVPAIHQRRRLVLEAARHARAIRVVPAHRRAEGARFVGRGDA